MNPYDILKVKNTLVKAVYYIVEYVIFQSCFCFVIYCTNWLHPQVFQTILEPADIVDEMHEAATQFLSQVEDERISSNPLAFQVTTDLLSCLVSVSSPTQKLPLEKLAQHHVERFTSPSSLPTLFKILRQLKTSNIKLCDAFWSRTLECMVNMPEEREDYKLFRVSHRLVEESSFCWAAWLKCFQICVLVPIILNPYQHTSYCVMRFFVFFSSFMQVPGQCVKLSHNASLQIPHSSSFMNHTIILTLCSLS